MNNQGTAPVGRFNLANLLILLLMLLVLSACGGGDDDPVPSVSVDSPVVTEGDTSTVPMTFTLTLSEAQEDAFTVNVATADDTAEAGDDYTARSGEIVTFSAGSTSATFTVDITGDDDFEADETLSLVISNAQGVNTTGTGTITNDDDADPKGYFTGSATLNGTDYNDVTALVYDKRILLFSPGANAVYDITMATPNIEAYSGTVDVYVAGQIDSSAMVSVTGQTDESNLSGSFSGGAGFGEGSFTVTFDPNNNTGAGTDYSRIEADPAAKWQGDYHSVDTIGAEMFFMSDGLWGGGANSVPVCVIENPTLPLPIPAPQVNIFQVSNDIRNATASCQYGYAAPYEAENRYSGFASVINVTGTDDGLIFVETNGSYSIYAIMDRP